MNKVTRIGAAAAIGGLLASTGHAHGIWFAQRAKQIAVIYGIGADDLEAVKRQPMMESVAAYDADYKPFAATLRQDGPLVVVDVDAPPTLVSAVLQNGTWSWLPNGEIVKKTKDQVPNAIKTETTIKYAVTIQGPLAKPIPPLANQTLQIVPVGAIPTMLGQPLKYRVLYQGNPVAGAELINDMVNDPDAAPIKTGSDGTASLPVRNQGLNVIRAVYVSPSPDLKKADKVEHTATLAYTLAHKSE